MAEADEFVTLFHGTSAQGARGIRAAGIDLGKANPRADFGRGFYTTRSRAQAEKWVRARHPGGEVLEFRVPRSELERLRTLDIGSKPGGSLARFFRHNRLGGRMHSDSVVEGPLLGNPGRFLRGEAPRLFGQQTTFHTDEALRLLERSLMQ
ncbi:MAG: DUF3990 domain-containing protein [Myxococcales bacterium]|nr:DUF3990 domain-containing protein [Myxococcales bacterium]